MMQEFAGGRFDEGLDQALRIAEEKLGKAK